MAQDKINPQHYRPTGSKKLLERVIRLGDLQAIDVIEVFGLGPHLASTAKYILRAGKKSELGYNDALKEIEDLGKSIWYTLRYIQNVAEEHDIEVPEKTKAMFDLMLPPKLNLNAPVEVRTFDKIDKSIADIVWTARNTRDN